MSFINVSISLLFSLEDMSLKLKWFYFLKHNPGFVIKCPILIYVITFSVVAPEGWTLFHIYEHI